jgi:hypothetical protein
VIFKSEEDKESEEQLNSDEDVWSPNYKPSVEKQFISQKIYENVITSFAIALLKKRLDRKYFQI